MPESGYDVVLSSHQPQIPVFIFGEAIAADKPLSTKHLGSLFGPLPVVKHDSRIVLGSGEHSRLSHTNLFPRFVNEQRAVSGLRLSWRPGFNGHSGHIGKIVTELTHPQSVMDFYPQPVFPSEKEPFAQMFTGAQSMMEARKVKINFVCHTKHLSVHRRNGHKDVHLVPRDKLKKFLGVVLSAVDDRRATATPRVKTPCPQCVRPVEFPCVHDSIVGLQRLPVEGSRIMSDERALCVEHPLWKGCRPGGVTDVRH